jgi:hypothetical protein
VVVDYVNDTELDDGEDKAGESDSEREKEEGRTPRKGDRIELCNYDDSHEAMADGTYWCSGTVQLAIDDGDVVWKCDDGVGEYSGNLDGVAAWKFLS